MLAFLDYRLGLPWHLRSACILNSKPTLLIKTTKFWTRLTSGQIRGDC
jgi:hypothetical protein